MPNEMDIYQKVFEGGMTIEEAVTLLDQTSPPDSPKTKSVSSPPDRFPLSEGQKALWFINRLDPENYASNSPAAFWLPKDVDLDALHRSFQFLYDRHRGLRVSFLPENDQPVQRVSAGGEVRFTRVDVSGCSYSDLQDRIEKYVRAPFDLTRGRLMRIIIFTGEGERPILLMVFHHIIFDGGSFARLVNELARVYAAEITGTVPFLEPIAHDYSEFITWQQGMLRSEVGQRHCDFWRRQLSGELPVLTLPHDYPRPSARTLSGAVFAAELDKSLVVSLTKLARSERCTLFAVLLTAYKVLLFKYTDQQDLIVGTPVSGRPDTRFEETIGYFINMAPVRSRLSGEIPFRDYLRQVLQTFSESLDHGDFPFSLLVERLDIPRDDNRTPIFQVAFIFQNWLQALDPDVLDYDGANQGKGRLRLEPNDCIHEAGGFDLSLDIFDTKNKTMAFFKYNPDLYKENRIARMAEHYQKLLRDVIASPGKRLAELSLLSVQERNVLLTEFNQPEQEFAADTSIDRLIEEQCLRSPDAVALGFEDRALTYAALARRVNQLARYLRAKGVSRETPVAICVGRSLEMIIGLLGVLRTGGCYVPLDPAYPADRLSYILEDTQSPIVLTQTQWDAKIPSHFPAKVYLDSDWREINREGEISVMSSAKAGNLAYMIYTSGSTGKPKGVLITHRSLVNYVRSFIEHYRLGPEDRVLQFASISFDTAAEEIFPTLASGAGLMIRPEEITNDIDVFEKYLKSRGITVLDLPTAYWHEWVSAMNRTDTSPFSRLRLVIVGGESASSDRLSVWRGRMGDILVWSNTYGPTEATIAATLYEPTSAEPGS